MTKSDKDDLTLPLEQHAWEMARQPVGIAGQLGRTTQILRHYNLAQVGRRALNIAVRRLNRKKKVGSAKGLNSADLKTSQIVSKLAQLVVNNCREHPSHSRCNLGRGSFVLLNHEVQASGFRMSQNLLLAQTHLWRFQFHYHEFLLTQAAQGNWSDICEFLSGWLSDYDPEKTLASADSWHPYCISRRAIAWVLLLVYSRDQQNALGDELSIQMIESLVHQTQHLSSNLEWDLGGNHLLENAAALAIVGGVLESGQAANWRSIARAVLERELPSQVLSHGEHFELSPMYHCQILSNLLRIDLCCRDDESLTSLVDPYIGPMSVFLAGILHPDKEIPLFGDSGFHEAPSVHELTEVMNLSGRRHQARNTVDGFERYGDNFILNSHDTFAVCDFGAIAADQLPAHGHCDVLNLEVSIGSDRWIVDSGNFNYSNDSMRHYCRSSIAHNVVTFNDANQANVWSMFRMGSRPAISDQRHGEDYGWHWASAAHDGYAKMGVDKLHRLVASSHNTLVCIDTVWLRQGLPGQKLPGQGLPKHGSPEQEQVENLVGYLHLHPQTTLGEVVRVTDSIFQIQLQRSDTLRWLTMSADEVTIEQGWFCEQFGKRTANPVVRYLTNITRPYTWWALNETPDTLKIQFLDSLIEITMNGQDKFSWTMP